MTFNSKLILLMAVVFQFAACQEESPKARLLVTKEILNQFIVEQKDITLLYNVYNFGNSPAYDVELKDENFHEKHFDVMSGCRTIRWPFIPGASNVSHSLVVQSRTSGYFNFTAALLTYRTEEGGKEDSQVIQAYTTTPGEHPIYNLKDFKKRYSYHFTDWVCFWLICIPSLLIPFLLWSSSNTKYTRLANQKKTK